MRGTKICSDAMRALAIGRTGGLAERLTALGTSHPSSKCWRFASSTRGKARAEKEEGGGSTRAWQRSRAREWEADDHRGDRWRTGGRPQKSPHVKRKNRENTWQNSDPHEDLCRIKWDPDPEVIPDNWFRGHIPDMIKCKMFDLWQEDPEKNTAMALGKRFGLPYLDVQAILTMKRSAKEKAETIEGYEIYPEIEELMTERKEAFIEDLGIHYGQEIPFVYLQCPDVDKNDPDSWVEPREFKMVKLQEKDKNTRFDRPPLKDPDQVAEEMKYNRTNKAIYAAVRDEEAAELTKKLAEKPALAQKRWAYAMKDTSNRETKKGPVVMRGRDGKMRGATVNEERDLSYADENLFRRDVRRWSTLGEMP